MLWLQGQWLLPFISYTTNNPWQTFKFLSSLTKYSNDFAAPGRSFRYFLSRNCMNFLNKMKMYIWYQTNRKIIFVMVYTWAVSIAMTFPYNYDWCNTIWIPIPLIKYQIDCIYFSFNDLDFSNNQYMNSSYIYLKSL